MVSIGGERGPAYALGGLGSRSSRSIVSRSVSVSWQCTSGFAPGTAMLFVPAMGFWSLVKRPARASGAQRSARAAEALMLGEDGKLNEKRRTQS